MSVTKTRSHLFRVLLSAFVAIAVCVSSHGQQLLGPCNAAAGAGCETCDDGNGYYCDGGDEPPAGYAEGEVCGNSMYNCSTASYSCGMLFNCNTNQQVGRCVSGIACVTQAGGNGP